MLSASSRLWITYSPRALDLVITNAVKSDYWSVVKADIGIRDGKVVGIGKAGNPLYQVGVDPNMVCGPGTEVYSAEGLIATAGLIDPHIHFVCPQQAWTALYSGITTMIGGGTGPTPAPMPRPARPAPVR